MFKFGKPKPKPEPPPLRQYGPETAVRMDTARYAHFAEGTRTHIYGMLRHMAHEVLEGGEVGDIGPVLEGALAGILEFCIRGGMTEEAVRRMLADACDDILPQVVFAKAVVGSGASAAGHA